MIDWSSVALSDILVDAKPGFACGEDVEDGVFQVRMNNVTTSGELTLAKRRRVPRSIANLPKYSVEPGDVLFNATNSPELVGKAAYFAGLDEPTVFSNHFLRLRPISNSLDGRFLARWLNLQFERGVFEGMCRKWVNQATVNRDSLLAMNVPLPPLEAQRRIAEILDKADALRAKRRASLAQLDTLAQSVFLDMFGDPVHGPKWPIKPLGSLLDRIRYGPRFYNEAYSNDGVRVVRISDLMENGSLDFDSMPKLAVTDEEFEKSALRTGDVIFARTGATVGKTAVVRDSDPPSIAGAYFIVMRFNDRIEPAYARSVLSSSSIRDIVSRRSRQAAQQNFSGPGLRELPMPVPPLPIQRTYVARLCAIDGVAETLRSSRRDIESLFASLQHRAFRGEL